MVQWFCLIAWRLIDIWTPYFGIESVWPDVWPQNICRTLWPIFHSPVILPCILTTIQWLNIIFLEYESVYDPIFYLKINVGHCELYFMVQWLCLIAWTVSCMKIIIWDYESVWPKPWPQNKYRSTWPIFHGLVILLNIFKIIWWMNIIIGIMDQCDTKIDLIKYM